MRRFPSITLRSSSCAAPTALLVVNIGVVLGSWTLAGCSGSAKGPVASLAPPPAVSDNRPVVQHDLFAAPFRLGTDRAAR